MVYKPNTPTPTEVYFPNSQEEILENFQQINTVYSVDHIGPTASTDRRGYHNAVRFLDNGGDPTTEKGYSVLYGRQLDTGDYGVCYRQKNNGAISCFGEDSGGGGGNGPQWGLFSVAVALSFDGPTGNILSTPKNIASVTAPYVVFPPSSTPNLKSYCWDVVFTNPIQTDPLIMLSCGKTVQAGTDTIAGSVVLGLNFLTTTGCTVAWGAGVNVDVVYTTNIQVILLSTGT